MDESPASRRRFLQAGAAAALLPGCVTTGPAAGRGYIDAHSHIWTRDIASYPLNPPSTLDDLKPPSFTAEELLATCRPHGVERVVLISHFRFHGYDNSYLVDSAAKYPGTFAVVGAIDPTRPDLDEAMPRLKQQRVTGYRIRSNHGKTRVPDWLDRPGMDAMFRLGAKHHIAMCMLITTDALPSIAPMLEKHPETPVVIDHFGRVDLGQESELRQLLDLARFPKVHVKISAFHVRGARKPPHTELIPKIKRVFEAFGPQRLMWATDCPYALAGENTYGDSIGLIRDRIDWLSAEDKTWLLRRTAENVYFQA